MSHAMVAINPPSVMRGARPVFASTKQPVPYVFFASPGAKQVWPNSADC